MVRRALAVAPDADRRLLLLRYREEWTDAELADLLSITPGAVRSACRTPAAASARSWPPTSTGRPPLPPPSAGTRRSRPPPKEPP
jgi:hypothetical protein